MVEFEIIQTGNQAKCDLIINDSLSIWKIKIDSSTYEKELFFIKNHPGNAVYTSERILNLTFDVKDSLHSMKWELMNDTCRILNKKCFAAKTYFRGRSYTAFYSPDYAISDGPWKFGGLPGLILKVKSDDNFIQFTADKIMENYSGKVDLPKIRNLKFIEWDDYVKKYIDAIARWTKLARSNGAVDENTELKIKIDEVEIIYPKAQLGEGIKF